MNTHSLFFDWRIRHFISMYHKTTIWVQNSSRFCSPEYLSILNLILIFNFPLSSQDSFHSSSSLLASRLRTEKLKTCSLNLLFSKGDHVMVNEALAVSQGSLVLFELSASILAVQSVTHSLFLGSYSSFFTSYTTGPATPWAGLALPDINCRFCGTP